MEGVSPSNSQDDDYNDMAIPWKVEPGMGDEKKPSIAMGLDRSQPIQIDDDDVTVNGDTDPNSALPHAKPEMYPPKTV